MVVAEKPFNKWSLRDKSGGNAAAIRLSATLDVRPDAPPLNPWAGRGTWRGPDLRGSRGFLRGLGVYTVDLRELLCREVILKLK